MKFNLLPCSLTKPCQTFLSLLCFILCTVDSPLDQNFKKDAKLAILLNFNSSGKALVAKKPFLDPKFGISQEEIMDFFIVQYDQQPDLHCVSRNYFAWLRSPCLNKINISPMFPKFC